ncbi:lipase family protein, partial [Cronobacter sakazakii]|uniref:lipase family protein n=1 Tax=Cronobacter sakazakii TaxID=28141 RepID=UPI00294B2116
GLTAIGIASLRRCYARLDTRITEHIDHSGQQLLTAAGRLDTVRAGARFANQNFDDHCNISLAELMAVPEIVEVFNDVRLGQHVPACPVPVLHPKHDQIIDVGDVDAQVDRYLAADGQVNYVRDRCSEHITLMLISAPLALNWLKNRRLSTATATGRNISIFSIALSAKAIRGYFRM